MTGTVTLSIEIELGWGVHDLNRNDPFEFLSPGRKVETRTLERLLKLCDRLSIPITFDIVGHLFLESCDGTHCGPHPADWFEADPGTTWEKDPYFYAPDLVRAVIESDTDHEIATHTFSHVLCDEVDQSVLEWELERVLELHNQKGLNNPRSVVPPRHQSPSASLLAEYGIRTNRRRQAPKKDFYMYKWMNYRWHPTRKPEEDEGIIHSYATHSLSSPVLPNGQRPSPWKVRAIPLSVRQHMHSWYLKQGLIAAAERAENVHFWTHLYNISNDQQWAPVHQFLEELARLRDEQSVSILKMCDL